MMLGDRNILVILSSPSGVGKTTITKKFQQKYNNFKISVSHTTRPHRSNEIDGVDYHFVTKKEFEKLIDEKQFYEYAKIFENYYGTLKKMLMRIYRRMIFYLILIGKEQNNCPNTII